MASGYGVMAWGSIPWGDGFITSLPAEVQETYREAYGSDIWFDVRASFADYEITPHGDWVSVDGDEALIQSILRRIVTNPGEWQTKPEYGCGARLYIKARNTPAARAELEQRIRSNVKQDSRVERVDSVIIEQEDDTLRIAVIFFPKVRTARNRPLAAAVQLS